MHLIRHGRFEHLLDNDDWESASRMRRNRVSSRLYMHDDESSIPVCLSLTYEAMVLHGVPAQLRIPWLGETADRTLQSFALDARLTRIDNQAGLEFSDGGGAQT